MNLNRLILLFIIIITVSCEFIDYGIEEIAALILSAGNSDGTIAKELDPNSTGNETRPIVIDVSKVNNEGELMNIKQIIPSLNNLEGKKLDDKFKKLYNLSKRIFNTFMDGEEERGEEINYLENVNSYDFLRELIRSRDENESIGIYNNNLKTRIIFLRNDNYNTMMKKFIYKSYNNNRESFIDIDINNFDKLNQNIQSLWHSRNTDGIPSDKLSKVIAIKCIKTKACNMNFEKINDNEVNNYLDKISFNIVETTDIENNLYYSLIINNDNSLKIYHSFTIKYDGKLYSSYEKFPGRVNDYDDISYMVECYHYSINDETNEIEREGISLVAESGINLIVRPTNSEGKPILLTPSDYIVKDKDGNIKIDSINSNTLYAEIATDDEIKNLLHLNYKRNDIFSSFNRTSLTTRSNSDENLEDEYYNTYITENYYNIISDKYSSKFASIKELSKRFLNERLGNSYTDPLTEYELLNINALHQIMGIKYTFRDPLDVYQDGMLHHKKNQEIEFINGVTYLEESRYLSSFTQTEINFNFRDCKSNDCFKNFAYPISYYDLDESLSKLDKYIADKYENSLKDRDDSESSHIDRWFQTCLHHVELIEGNSMSDNDKEMVSQQLIDAMTEEFRVFQSRYNLHQQDETFPLTENDVHSAETLNSMLDCLTEGFNLHVHRFGPLQHRYENTYRPAQENYDIVSEINKNDSDIIGDGFADTNSQDSSSSTPIIRIRSHCGSNKERATCGSLDGVLETELDVDPNNLSRLVMNEDIPDSRLEEEKKRLKKKSRNIKRHVENIKIKNNDEYEPTNGSEAAFKLDNAITNKLKTIAPNDKKVQGTRITPESKIPKSTNVFSLKSVLGDISDLKDFIVNNVFSKDTMSLIGTYIKYEIYSLAEFQNTTTTEIEEDLVDLRVKLKENLNKFLSNYEPTNDLLNEAKHLVEAVTTFNSIITFSYNLETALNERLDDRLKKIDPEENEFIENVEYLRNENLLDGLNKLIRINHEKLGIEIEGIVDDFDIRERLFGGVGSKYYMYNKIYKSNEPSSEDFSKLLNTNVKSKGEGIAIIANAGKPEECSNIKKSVSLKNKILRLKSPLSRDQDEIDENERLSNTISKKVGNIEKMNSKKLEAYGTSIYRTLYEYLETLSYTGVINLDGASNGNDGYFEYSSVCSIKIYDNPRALFGAIEDGTINAIYNTKSDPIKTEEIKKYIIISDKRVNTLLKNFISNILECIDIENADTIDDQLYTLNQFIYGVESVMSANSIIGKDFKSSFNSDFISRSTTYISDRTELTKHKTIRKPKKNEKLKKIKLKSSSSKNRP